MKDEGEDSFNNRPNGHGAPGRRKYQNKRGRFGHLESSGLLHIYSEI